jgi:hypothetical protein
MSRWFRDFRRRWLLPPGVHDASVRLISDLKCRFSPSRRKRLAPLGRNRDLQNRFRGRPGFVIANGPSLAGQDLAPLAGEVTIVMNAFYRHPILSSGWRPTVHCMAEPATAYDDPLLLQLLRDCTSISAEIHIFPLEVRRVLQAHQLLPDEEVHYVDFWRDLSVYSPSQVLSLAAPLPYLGGTAHLSLVAAMFLGCSPIYLLGFDHDCLSHRGMDRHFYAHQGPETVAGGLWDLRRFSYLELLEAMTRDWKSYYWLRRIAERHGIEIYNATDGGFLDVFERARYEDVIARRTAA